jgi:hypothetical protein
LYGQGTAGGCGSMHAELGEQHQWQPPSQPQQQTQQQTQQPWYQQPAERAAAHQSRAYEEHRAGADGAAGAVAGAAGAAAGAAGASDTEEDEDAVPCTPPDMPSPNAKRVCLDTPPSQ